MWHGTHKNEDENRVWALRAAGARTTESNRKLEKNFKKSSGRKRKELHEINREEESKTKSRRGKNQQIWFHT